MISPTRWWVASDRIADPLSACCSAAGDRGGERAGRRCGAGAGAGSDIRVAGMVLGDRRQAIGLVSADHHAAVREFLSRAAATESTGRSP
jgi:uncharacterized protein YfiM (DUF2279 family)